VLLKSVAESLLLPPISLLVLALVGLLIERRSRMLGRWLAFVGIVGTLLLGTPFVSGTLLFSLERNLPTIPPPDAPPQAIVILGGDLRRSGDSPGITLYPGLLSLERLRDGAALYRQTRLPVLITGGRQRLSEPSIAKVMADSLQHDFEVPVEWLENSSVDTWQNAQLSAAILREHGIKSIYLVTHAWHMRRALMAFSHTGLVVTAAPVPLDRMPHVSGMAFVPNVGGWLGSFYAVHEWIGCAWYALQ
jgi:uncharacterized SAM-binding protein YcdF (DUF218 family)